MSVTGRPWASRRDEDDLVAPVPASAGVARRLIGLIWVVYLLEPLVTAWRTTGADRVAGVGLLALFVRAGLATSNGEARRHVQGGAVRINDAAVSDDKRVIGSGDVNAEGVIKLSLGKKKHVLVKPV